MSEWPQSKKPDVLIGGGVGVAIVLLADAAANQSVKQALLYAAPFVSMLVGSIVTWLRNFGSRELQIKYKQWDLVRVKKQLASILADPDHPDEFKLVAQARVRDLEMQILTLMMQDVDVKETKKGA